MSWGQEIDTIPSPQKATKKQLYKYRVDDGGIHSHGPCPSHIGKSLLLLTPIPLTSTHGRLHGTLSFPSNSPMIGQRSVADDAPTLPLSWWRWTAESRIQPQSQWATPRWLHHPKKVLWRKPMTLKQRVPSSHWHSPGTLP